MWCRALRLRRRVCAGVPGRVVLSSRFRIAGVCVCVSVYVCVSVSLNVREPR